MQHSHIHYTNPTPVMSRCSWKIKPRTDRPGEKGCPLILQVFIEGSKTVIDLGFRVKPEQWDPGTETVKGKSTDIQHINAALDTVKAAIYRIKSEAQHQGKPLTIEFFKEAFLQRDTRTDFVQWFRKELHARHTAGTITYETYKNNRNTFNKFSNRYPQLAFSDISHSVMEEFHRFLHRSYAERDKRLGLAENYHTNSIHGHFKVLKIYMRAAAKAGIKFQDPFKSFKVPRGNSRIIYLNQHELAALLSAWRAAAFIGTDHYAITIFLFACYTSLRISDIKSLTHQDIIQDHIIIRPKKTARSGKIVRIPLNDISRQIIQSRQSGMFSLLSEQKVNAHLKKVAAILGITKKLSMHVGRHTFATEFLRRGGQVHVLQKILGHSDIKTTMVYTHLDDQHLISQMQIMNH